MNNINIVKHSLIEHKLTVLRDVNTPTKIFRETLEEITALLTYEITRDLPLKDKSINTPLMPMIGKELKCELTIVPILRAGLGMVEGIHRLIPTAKIGHIGLYRDEETLKPKEYYAKFPLNMKDTTVLLLDPMLATGNSTIKAASMIYETGVKEIIFVGVVASPAGVNNLKNAHPNIKMYLAAVDTKLNDVGYIVPGLGDAGDRLFGTK